jgi:hypothetical protein
LPAPLAIFFVTFRGGAGETDIARSGSCLCGYGRSCAGCGRAQARRSSAGQELLAMPRHRADRRESASASAGVPYPGITLSDRIARRGAGRRHHLRPSGHARIHIREQRGRRHHRLSEVNSRALEAQRRNPRRAAAGRIDLAQCPSLRPRRYERQLNPDDGDIHEPEIADTGRAQPHAGRFRHPAVRLAAARSSR